MTAGVGLQASSEEHLAAIQTVCRGFGDPFLIQDTDGRGWYLPTPARDASGRPVFGRGETHIDAIEDCWRRFISTPFQFAVPGHPAQHYRWDGLRFVQA